MVGAVVGARALIWVHPRTERSARELERRAAFVDFYAAANSFALMYHVWSEMQLGTSWFAQLWLGIRMDDYTKTFLARLWHVQDAFWQSSGRGRSVRTPMSSPQLTGSNPRSPSGTLEIRFPRPGTLRSGSCGRSWSAV